MNGDWGVGSALVMFCLECVVVPMRLRWLMCSCVLPAFGVGCDLVVCLFRFALFCYIRQLEELKKAGDADPMTAFGNFATQFATFNTAKERQIPNPRDSAFVAVLSKGES